MSICGKRVWGPLHWCDLPKDHEGPHECARSRQAAREEAVLKSAVEDVPVPDHYEIRPDKGHPLGCRCVRCTTAVPVDEHGNIMPTRNMQQLEAYAKTFTDEHGKLHASWYDASRTALLDALAFQGAMTRVLSERKDAVFLAAHKAHKELLGDGSTRSPEETDAAMRRAFWHLEDVLTENRGRET